MKTKINRMVSVVAIALITFSNFESKHIKFPIVNAATLTAFDIIKEMKIGWNVGNSLDAYFQDKDGNTIVNAGLDSEICWGNPAITEDMIKTVKTKGFNTIRIPTTWFQHVDENYNVDPNWMTRVKQVVDMAYNNGMYVILNMHHEEGWANRPDLGTAYDKIKPYFTKVWLQIASEFANYDQHLVFECMNEPRAKGTSYEWWAATAPQAECDVINNLNADIVKVIRGVDSPYKETRLIMLPSYCASSDPVFMNQNKMPEGDFYLAASVHAYTPYNFTMNDEIKDHSQFTKQYENELKNCLENIKKTFCDHGIPVIIGEFSTSNYDNTQARIEWAQTYITTTKGYGMPCILWDNNVENGNGGESHGYLNRNTCTWYEESEKVVDVMIKIINDSFIEWGENIALDKNLG